MSIACGEDRGRPAPDIDLLREELQNAGFSVAVGASIHVASPPVMVGVAVIRDQLDQIDYLM